MRFRVGGIGSGNVGREDIRDTDGIVEEGPRWSHVKMKDERKMVEREDSSCCV